MRLDDRFAITGRILLYLIPAVAIVGLALPPLLGLHSLSLLGSYLAIPMIAGTILFLIYRESPYQEVRLNERIFYLFIAAYAPLFTISALILATYTPRPIGYYLVITLLATIVLMEILLFEATSGRVLIILAQIIALNLNLIWGVTMKYHLFIGRMDPISHIFYISTLMEAAHVTDAFDNYRAFPLWHVLVYALYIIMRSPLPLEKMIFLANGLVYAFLVPMAYLVSRAVFKDRSLALMISLFIVFYTDVLLYGMSSIPRSVVSFLELILLYFIFIKDSTMKLFIIVTLTIVLILYHPVSLPFILVIFSIIIILDLIYESKEGRTIGLRYLFFSIVFCIGYWMYNSIYILEGLLENVMISVPSLLTTKSIADAPFDELFNYLQYAPLLLFIVFGILWALNDERFSTRAKMLCLVGVLLVAVSFPGPMLLFTHFVKRFNIMRFGEYAFIFIIMASAVGFSGLFHKARRYGRSILVVTFMALIFLSVSNDFTASDNPIVKRTFYTFYMSENEVDSTRFLPQVAGGYVMSDYVVARYLECSPFQEKAHVLEVDRINMRLLRNSSDDLLLIRASELDERPLKLYTSIRGNFVSHPNLLNLLDYYMPDLAMWGELSEYNRIYDSGAVQGLV
ncbi:MAG: hypothetical protein JW986_10345 [Methanotrichaceae archaeon]|nr:hypothetical protein [Methanotrichaceae archaeon]